MKQQLISILKTNIQISLAWICFILGWAMVIAAFCTPPPGEVSDSVLWIFGQSLVFVGTCIGLDISYNNKLERFKHNMEKDFSKFTHNETDNNYNNGSADYYSMQDTEDGRDPKDS